jgi:hypothetical protein
MKHPVPALLFAALLFAFPAIAETLKPDRAAHEAALKALGEPRLILTGCLPEPKETQVTPWRIAEFLENEGSASPFAFPFDEAAAKEVIGLMEGAIAATPQPNAFPPVPDDLDFGLVSQEVAERFATMGLDPESVIDVGATYLLFVWAAQEGDLSLVWSGGRDHVNATRYQIAFAEMRCFSLGKEGEALADARNLMIAHIIFLDEGMQAANRAGETTAFGTFVRENFGRQIEGLELTLEGFVPAP